MEILIANADTIILLITNVVAYFLKSPLKDK